MENGNADGSELMENERLAYAALVQAKWRQTLATDHIGFQQGRLYQFGEISAEVVDEAVMDVGGVWTQLSRDVIQSSFEAYHTYLLQKNVGAGNRLLVGKKKPVLVAAEELLGLQRLAPDPAAAATARSQPHRAKLSKRAEAAGRGSLRMVLGTDTGSDEDGGSSPDERHAPDSPDDGDGSKPPSQADGAEQPEDIEILLDGDVDYECEDQSAQLRANEALIDTQSPPTAAAEQGGFEKPHANPGTPLGDPGLAAGKNSGKGLTSDAPIAPHTAPRTASRGGPVAEISPQPQTADVGSGDASPAVKRRLACALEDAGASPGDGTAAGVGTERHERAASAAPQRRKPVLPASAPATTPQQQQYKKRRIPTTPASAPPSIETVAESLLAPHDTVISHLLAQKKADERLEACRRAQAVKLKEHHRKAEVEAEQARIELQQANEELASLANRVQAIKAHQDLVMHRSLEIEELHAVALREAEQARDAARETAEAITAKKREARKKLEASVARLTDMASKKYA